MPDLELDPEASRRLAELLERNDADRARAGLTAQQAAELNLQLAREQLARKRRRR